MRFILIVSALFCFSLLGQGCRSSSSSCGMQKTNSKLIAGNYDFGKSKEAKKYKKKNRR